MGTSTLLSASENGVERHPDLGGSEGYSIHRLSPRKCSISSSLLTWSNNCFLNGRDREHVGLDP